MKEQHRFHCSEYFLASHRKRQYRFLLSGDTASTPENHLKQVFSGLTNSGQFRELLVLIGTNSKQYHLKNWATSFRRYISSVASRADLRDTSAEYCIDNFKNTLTSWFSVSIVDFGNFSCWNDCFKPPSVMCRF